MAEADRQQGQIEPRQRLLPSFGKLAGIYAIVLLLSRGSDGVICAGMVAIIVYIVIVLRRTMDLVDFEEPLHPVDSRLLRYSGPLALTAVTLFTGGALVLDVSLPDDSDWLVAILFTAQLIGEIGLIFTIACLSVKDQTRHVAPLVVWKVACVPLLFVFMFATFFATAGLMLRNSIETAQLATAFADVPCAAADWDVSRINSMRRCCFVR